MSPAPDPFCTHLEVLDTAEGLSLPVQVLAPTRLEGQPRPLVLFSHGSGGSGVLYATLTTTLARAGYVVAIPEHPGNHRKDNALGGTHRNLALRPRHLRMAAEAVLREPRLGALTDPRRLFAIGHSLGACSALALAGGQPWDRQGQRVEVAPDPRVQALVLLAPAAAYFRAPGALAAVAQPILLISAAEDTVTPRWQTGVILEGVPVPSAIEHREIPGAGHFSFLSPFPKPLRRPGLAPAEDPPGFDREAFHAWLPDLIRTWLEARS
nr:alpha/beta fold hydrolase [uncultured Holophaga sp.]